jgi:hypothetical protein
MSHELRTPLCVIGFSEILETPSSMAAPRAEGGSQGSMLPASIYCSVTDVPTLKIESNYIELKANSISPRQFAGSLPALSR